MAIKKDTKKPEEKKSEVVTPIAASVIPPVKLPKAFYIEKEKGVWRLIIAEVDGDKIINKKIKECDNKALSLENFKIEFGRHYYFGK